VEPQPIPRRPRKKLEKANLAAATLIAIIAGLDVFLFSTNPLVFVTIGLGVGIAYFNTSDKIKLLILGALAGVPVLYISLVLSNVERQLLVWIGASIAAFIATSITLHPRIRQRFTWKALFSASFASVCFIATLVIFATFLSPISFLQISGVQASFVAVNSPNNKKLLLDYTAQINDSAAGMNYLQLLNWTRHHFAWGTATSKTDPLEILKIGRGACEDYAWVYVGLLVANNYTARLILDCSFSLWPIKDAGNHSWVEVLINGTWVTIDPSLDPSYGVNNPYLYARGWNKTINHIYAITENEILDVTASYIPPS
jgi:transglutaminase-like putative cysteine protease